MNEHPAQDLYNELTKHVYTMEGRSILSAEDQHLYRFHIEELIDIYTQELAGKVTTNNDGSQQIHVGLTVVPPMFFDKLKETIVAAYERGVRDGGDK